MSLCCLRKFASIKHKITDSVRFDHIKDTDFIATVSSDHVKSAIVLEVIKAAQDLVKGDMREEKGNLLLRVKEPASFL